MKRYLFVFFTIVLFLLIPSFPVSALTSSDSDSDVNLYKEQLEAIQVLSYQDKKIYITDKDLYLLAQVVCAESRAEPYQGKVAVASVILNRLRNPEFPKTVEGVIKQKGAFSCIRNGEINIVPDEESYRAVLEALKGNDPTERAVFFYNPRIATSSWMKNVNKKGVKTIGNHVFFVVR